MTVQLGMPQPRVAGSPGAGVPAAAALSGRPEGLPAGLVDRYGRRATDMRLSLTDKCNLRCTYCMPAEGLEWLSKQAVMSAEEIVRIVRIGVDMLGVRELRLTHADDRPARPLDEALGTLERQPPLGFRHGGAQPRAVAFLVRPTGPETIDVEIGYIFHPSALDDPLFEHKLKLADVGVQVFVEQDQDATTKVQRGLRSRFAPRGRYSWQEESHVQFNRWLVQRYRRHAEA